MPRSTLFILLISVFAIHSLLAAPERITCDFPKFPAGCYPLALPKPEMTNSDFENLLLDKSGHLKIHSVDDLVPLLPQSMRDHPVFIYSRESRQANTDDGKPLVTASSPRVIVTDQSGQFRLAYVGCPDNLVVPECSKKSISA